MESFEKYKYKFQEIPTAQIESDPSQPRSILHSGESKSDGRLLESIKAHGILQPIVVHAVGPDRNIVIDGRRRYLAGKQLGFQAMPCMVYSDLSPVDIATIRYEAQTNRE